MVLKISLVLLCSIFVEIATIEYPHDFAPKLSSGEHDIKFQFIVVGGGSAGAVVATRLSEITDWNVLLLEAGSDPPATTEIPLKWSLAMHTEYDWEFFTETQEKVFKGLKDERSYIPRGCMLGGSSSMNVMLYLRGTKFDYDKWESMGCPGWGFEENLEYFKKNENFTDDTRFDPQVHGNSGPISVSPYVAPDPAIGTIGEAADLMGLKNVKDLNKLGRTTGYAMSDSTTKNGLRCSTLKGYLIPNSERPNLFVAKKTRVTKVLIENKKAYGVEFVTATGEFKTVNCTKEVIVSAGVMMSPQLLMLSGIGPAQHLNDMQIDLVADLPVGLNYQDHIAFYGMVLTDRKNRPKEDIAKESQQLRKETMQLIPKGISTMGLTGLVSFVDTTGDQQPDIEIMKIRFSYNTTKQLDIFRRMFSFSDDMANIYNELGMLSDIILMIPISNHIVNTGHVELASKDPLVKPKIYANFLTDQAEYDVLIEGIKFVVDLCKKKPMVDAGYELAEIKFPGCPDIEFDSKEYWTCAIDHVASSIFHSVGTNRMGAADDKTAVVDIDLKVKGVENLRVIDSSVMPHLVSCNTNAATMMIAEKASDKIKTQYGKCGTADSDAKSSADQV
ncbi:Glucose-methanol-choline oxidoreductase, C-terminal,Glucose-methanol-choline oxidoreductase, N- [Cinara cedri]|uniref:Glucose-methanol-choline oxidoreductase, C-terminal,Glucose-methanol-choline oxidoreductase, N n=1 Tax=Cinara cedri TaxID=506608 RepID=A0A5E4MW80_9HEMI|nr:Glucose-methanol-choline oxidoreductase, C-terminal,Glucose-methanol-choline oxidoreductase, N- [Cinara cedri]